MNSLKELFEKIVESPFFNNFIIVVIILNAVIIGLETYPSMAQYAGWFNILHIAVITIFVLEALIKILAVAPEYKKYFGDAWNLFDFCIVVVSFIPSVGSFASIARTARLLRVMRLVSQFRDLRVVVGSLVRSIPSVVSVLLLMFLLFYIYAIFGVHFFGVSDPLRWGSLGRAMLTLFTMVTLEGWDRLLYNALEVNSLAWIYFVSFIIIGALMISNLFVGIILFNITNVKKSGEKQKEFHEKVLMELRETKELVSRLEEKMDSMKNRRP